MLADAWLAHGPSAVGRGATSGRRGFSFGIPPVHSHIPRQRGSMAEQVYSTTEFMLSSWYLNSYSINVGLNDIYGSYEPIESEI